MGCRAPGGGLPARPGRREGPNSGSSRTLRSPWRPRPVGPPLTGTSWAAPLLHPNHQGVTPHTGPAGGSLPLPPPPADSEPSARFSPSAGAPCGTPPRGLPPTPRELAKMLLPRLRRSATVHGKEWYCRWTSGTAPARRHPPGGVYVRLGAVAELTRSPSPRCGGRRLAPRWRGCEGRGHRRPSGPRSRPGPSRAPRWGPSGPGPPGRTCPPRSTGCPTVHNAAWLAPQDTVATCLSSPSYC